MITIVTGVPGMGKTLEETIGKVSDIPHDGDLSEKEINVPDELGIILGAYSASLSISTIKKLGFV